MVTIEEYRAHVTARRPLTPGSRMLQFMHEVSARTCLLYQEMNAAVRTPDQIREYFSRLTGTEIDPSFTAHLPFTTDFGLNTRIGARVFINSGCRFQDQGGVTIGDGALIGHNVVLATLNHDEDPALRGTLHPAPIAMAPMCGSVRMRRSWPAWPSAKGRSSQRGPSSRRTCRPMR